MDEKIKKESVHFSMVVTLSFVFLGLVSNCPLSVT